MKYRQFYLPLLCLLFFGCEKYYVSVKKELFNQSTLASTFVGSPDPRQANPPVGQDLILTWKLPQHIEKKSPLILVLTVIYKNFTEERFTYPVERRRGVVVKPFVTKEFGEKKGLLTYKAEVTTLDGEVIREWKQRLWTDLITND